MSLSNILDSGSQIVSVGTFQIIDAYIVLFLPHYERRN
jgi:hypothetical protein